MSRFGVFFIALSTAIALVSCGGSEPEETPLDSETSTPAVQGEPLDNKVALDAGAYCYRTDGETLQAIAELLVEPDSSVTGTLSATVTDDENAYYTSYDQNFAGVLDGETLNASITTEIEYDVQNTEETWTLNQDQFSSDSAVLLKRVDCEEIIALKAAEKTESKPIPTAQAPLSTPKPTAAPAPSQPKPRPAPAPTPQATAPTSTAPKRVQFNSGATETVVQGKLAANQTQVYLINAQEGQDMYLEIANASGDAIFDVEVDNGEVIQEELPEYLDFTLPFSGDYIVTVRGTENNTAYALTIRVK